MERIYQKGRASRRHNLEYCLGAMNLRMDDLVPIGYDEYKTFLADLKRKVSALPPEPKYAFEEYRMPDGQVFKLKSPNIFAWREVVDSLENRVMDAYRLKGTCCAACGGQGLAVICFRSNSESWKSRCGKEGYMLICTDCMRQLRFKSYQMNDGYGRSHGRKHGR